MFERGGHEAGSRARSLVVVGNGMTSWRLCRELAERSAACAMRIVVIGNEPVPAYDRVRLTTLLSGASISGLLLSGAEWYAAAGIELQLGREVTAIDRGRHLVRTSDGREVGYDRLVLATG